MRRSSVHRSPSPARRAWFLGALLATGAALLPVASATAHDPDPVFSGGPMTPGSVLRYQWASGGVPPSAMKTAIKAAAGDANASRASKAPTFSHVSSSSNAIYYGTSVPCGANGLACMRRSTPDWFGIWLRENGHRFDWGTLRWCELTGSPKGCYRAETITLDELGHVLGLDHHVNFGDDRDYEDAVVQTYSHTKPGTGWNADRFARCDVAALQQLYDVPTSSTLYSTCLKIPTTLSLAASSTYVMAGSSVTFTARLHSDGTGKLSNNLISSRKVVLQRYVDGAWSDVGTMSAGSSGTYHISLEVWSATTYRARFRKPSNEGLKASSSPSVSISVWVYIVLLRDVRPAEPAMLRKETMA
jgi:hypothetical protein